MARPRPQSRSSRLPVVGAVLLAVAVVGIGVWMFRARSGPTLASGACRSCNVLLITIDTLRSDRVGAFGGRTGVTPNLDRLAASGVRLTRAYTAAPLTLPSHASILTGVSPPVHGLRANGLFRLGPDLPTLATVFKSAGYRTGAFVGAFVLDARFGLGRGFDVYDDRYGEKTAADPTEGAERRAEDVIAPALAWILGAPGNSQPWLSWVHLYDPHDPYRAPEPYASRFEPYDAEVAYTDAMVGRLIDQLRSAGQLDHTLVVVTADHGESLGEHGERTHGVFTYDVTMRVPWFFWWSGMSGTGRSHDGLARLIDLAPTVADLTGVAAPSSFEGRSLLPQLNGGDAAASAYFEAMDANLTRNWAPLTGVVSGSFKLIDLPIPELYDLARDPAEHDNLFTREGDRARTLNALLTDAASRFAAKGSSARQATLSAESRQRLQALGYVASSTEPAHRTYTDADDPKRLISVSDDLNRAVAQFNAGERQQGMTAVRGIMTAHPGFPTAFGMYASMQRATGDLPGAIATLEDIVKRNIADTRVIVTLAGYLEEAGAQQKAIGVLEAVIASHPDFADAHNSLGAAYSAIGQHEKARAAFRKVLELDPSSATAYENLGVDELRAGDRQAAIADLTRALEIDPRLPAAHNALATTLMLSGRKDEAIAQWRMAIDLNPRAFDALFNLATALHDEGRRDEARPYIEWFVREAPPARYARDIEQFQRWLRE
ncbi:MAG TPA: sulfatase-like hydrolase/transferase [Vicinamibacterales bacterium]